MLEAIILLGAPGSGKGTTADDLVQATDLIHLSTGDMLREAIRSEHPVGREAKTYMDKGELVPDDVIMRLVEDRLKKGAADAKYIFDGFPRTTEQAELLDRFFSRNDTGRLSHVFLLEVDRQTLVNRIAGRRICRKCGAVYHITNIPSKVEGVCDACGGELYQRADDNAETVLNRLDVYEKQTASLIDYYEKKKALRRINATDRKHTMDVILAALKGASAGR